MINLNPTENNLVKFNLSISGTNAVPSSVRFLIGDSNSKIAFNAYRSTDNPSEWCATVYPLSDFMFHFGSGLIYATVEVVLNGRTIVPYNKPVDMNQEIEKIEVKSEPIPSPTDAPIETHRVEPPEEPVVVMPTEISAPIEQTVEEIIVKPSLIKAVDIKEEKKVDKNKPSIFKKQYKLKPLNKVKPKTVKEDLSIEKLIKDVVSIDDVIVKPINIKIEKQLPKEAPFKMIKKEVIYK